MKTKKCYYCSSVDGRIKIGRISDNKSSDEFYAEYCNNCNCLRYAEIKPSKIRSDNYEQD